MVRKCASALIQKFETARTDLLERMGRGLPDYASYQKVVGQCEQLRTVIEQVKAELKKEEGDEDGE